LQEKSAAAGFELKARLPVYPEFIRRGEEFLSSTMRARVERLADSDGFVKNGGPLRLLPPLQQPSAPSL
jgi:FO synthase